MYVSEHDKWADERRAVAAKKARAERRAAELERIGDLDSRLDRIVSRVLLWLSNGG